MPIGGEPTAAQVQEALAEFKADFAADKAAGNLAPPQNMPAPMPTSDPGAPQLVLKQPDLTGSELQSARDAWIAAGHDAARFDAAMKADGQELPKPVPAGQREHDQRYGVDPKQSPDDYTNIVWRDPQSLRDIGNVDREVKEAFASIHLPRNMAPALADRIRDLGLAWRDKTPEQKQAWVAEQKDAAAQSVGKDAFAAMERDARAMLKSTNNPFLLAIEQSGISFDPWLVRTLALHARNLDAWRKGRPGGV